MHTLRFGRKLNLPSTIAIKHQVRMLMAQYEVKKAEAEARPEVFRGQPSLAVPSVTPAGGSSRVNTDATTRNAPVGLTDLVVNDGPHNSDGLLLHGWDGPERVRAFISRRVMDDWVDPKQPYGRRRSLFRAEYNALGKGNLAAIDRIVSSKYRRGAAFNRQHPFVDVLLRGARFEQTGTRKVSCTCPSLNVIGRRPS